MVFHVVCAPCSKWVTEQKEHIITWVFTSYACRAVNTVFKLVFHKLRRNWWWEYMISSVRHCVIIDGSGFCIAPGSMDQEHFTLMWKCITGLFYGLLYVYNCLKMRPHKAKLVIPIFSWLLNMSSVYKYISVKF